MSKLFPKYTIDLDNGTVYSLGERKGFVGSKKDKDGYSCCSIYDIYGNHYKRNHEVIIAEGLQLPKHLWPFDEKGKRFQVDHIIPVLQGGTDELKNLRLVSAKDNCNNPLTIVNMKAVRKGKDPKHLHKPEVVEKAAKSKWKPIVQLTKNNEFVKCWECAKVASEKLNICRSEISACCNGGRMKKGKWINCNTAGDFKWMHKSDYEKMIGEAIAPPTII